LWGKWHHGMGWEKKEVEALVEKDGGGLGGMDGQEGCYRGEVQEPQGCVHLLGLYLCCPSWSRALVCLPLPRSPFPSTLSLCHTGVGRKGEDVLRWWWVRMGLQMVCLWVPEYLMKELMVGKEAWLRQCLAMEGNMLGLREKEKEHQKGGGAWRLGCVTTHPLKVLIGRERKEGGGMGSAGGRREGTKRWVVQGTGRWRKECHLQG
jgi:hypothetical protein